MGQELSQPLSPHPPNISPISSNLTQTSSLVYNKTTNIMSGDIMEGNQYDPTVSPNESSSTTFFSTERSDHSDDIDNTAELDTSDDTNPLSDTFEQQQSEQQPLYQRELRPSRLLKRAVPNTWVDADDTGDFDPQEEGCQARARRKKAKLSQRKKFDWNLGESDHSFKPAKRTRPIQCITFSTPAGRAAFAEICAKSEEKADQACALSLSGYRLRKRCGTDDGMITAPLDAAGVRVIASEPSWDPRNQPAARGCTSCPARGQRCSLLDNEHCWPCDDCNESGDDCQLIQEPELKQACTHCQYLGKKNKWVVCSFDYTHEPSEHRGRCAQCKKDGHKNCVAGPRPGVTRTRLRIGADGAPYRNHASVSQGQPRVKTCRQCLDSRRVCSFASRSQLGDENVCTACDMSGAVCEPLGKRKKTPARGQQTRQQPSDNPSTSDSLNCSIADEDFITLPSSPPQTPVSEESCRDPGFTPDPPGDTGGTVKTVRTKFCHPMLFDYQDETSDGSDPCHFCSCASFGLIGLEERTTEVIEWYDGRGWEEIGGGHRGDSIKSSQMCTPCTMTRMQIMVCDDHALRPIAESNMEADYEAALERLFDPELTAADRWCSVCCNLASWECCMESEVHHVEGCGLALCESCVTDLQECGGSLETLLQALEDRPSEARPAGLRADYELLKEDGLLMRYLKHSAKT